MSKKYVGARWLGKYEIEIGLGGRRIKEGDVASEIGEEQAKLTPGWEPVYEDESREVKAKGKEK